MNKTVVLLLSLLCFAAWGVEDHAKDVESQKEALREGKGADAAAMAKADRVELTLEPTAPNQGLPKKATITDAAEIKKILDAMTVKEVPPSAGEISVTLRFFKTAALLRQVWVYPSGEWGVVRLNTPSWVLGKNDELSKLLDELLKTKGK
jgi:hypothetical protein